MPKRIQEWLNRPQRTNRDALVVGLAGTVLTGLATYALGRLLDVLKLLDFDSSVPVWLAALLAGAGLAIGLLFGRRTVGGLVEEVDRLEARTTELGASEPYSEQSARRSATCVR